MIMSVIPGLPETPGATASAVTACGAKTRLVILVDTYATAETTVMAALII